MIVTAKGPGRFLSNGKNNIRLQKSTPKLTGASPMTGAMGRYLKEHPLTRAALAVCSRPGWGLKEAFENQHPLPIKEPPDEDVVDDESDHEPASCPKLLEEISANDFTRFDSGKLEQAVGLLREILNITSEQSEAISQEMTEAENKYSV